MTRVITDRHARALAVLLVVCPAAACAARGAGFVPPTLGGVPASDAADILRAARTSCDGVRTLTAQAALSGRIAGQRVRGRLDLGLTSSGQVRLEAVAPFGLLFVLAGERDRATLLLTRDERVLRDQPAEAIVEALAGIRLSPETLLGIAAGCPGEGGSVRDGQRFPDGLLQVTLETGGMLWVRPASAGPRLVAARLGALIIEYLDAFAGDAPRTIRLRQSAADGRAPSDIRLAFSQIELNGTLDPAAFAVVVPAGAQPVTLEELRGSGLLSGR